MSHVISTCHKHGRVSFGRHPVSSQIDTDAHATRAAVAAANGEAKAATIFSGHLEEQHFWDDNLGEINKLNTTTTTTMAFASNNSCTFDEHV